MDLSELANPIVILSGIVTVAIPYMYKVSLDREKRISDEAIEREARYSAKLDEMQRFMQDEFVGVIRENTKALNEGSQANSELADAIRQMQITLQAKPQHQAIKVAAK